MRRDHGILLVVGVAAIFSGCAGPKGEIEQPPAPAIRTPVQRQVVEKKEAARFSFIDRDLLDQLLFQASAELKRTREEEAKGSMERLSPEAAALLKEQRELAEKRFELFREISDLESQLRSVRDPGQKEAIAADIGSKFIQAASLYPRIWAGLFERRQHAAAAAADEAAVSELREEMESSYSRKEYSNVIALYDRFASEHPGWRPSIDMKLKYALSLYRTGREAAAIAVLSEALDDPVFKQRSAFYRYLLGNLLFQSGQFESAKEVYSALIEDQKEESKWAELAHVKMQLIHMAKGTEQQPPASGPPAPSQALAASEEKAEPVLGISPPAFTEEATPPSQLEAGVDTESIEERKRAQWIKFEMAKWLFESERYEEAIVEFRRLLHTSYRQESLERIQEAMNRFSQKKRSEAAELARKAWKSRDPVQKKELLVKALALLKEANEKYPENAYADKIRNNIRHLVREIIKIDPSFSPEEIPSSLSSNRKK